MTQKGLVPQHLPLHDSTFFLFQHTTVCVCGCLDGDVCTKKGVCDAFTPPVRSANQLNTAMTLVVGLQTTYPCAKSMPRNI
jgi:hypothetical protein